MQLPPRRAAVLAAVHRSLEQRGFAPTVREICSELGLRSPASVHSHLRALERGGLLKRDPRAARAVRPARMLDPRVGVRSAPPAQAAHPETPGVAHVPLLGSVAAGYPSVAHDVPDETLAVPPFMLGGAGEHFALRISGDSMRDAGILDGDHVVVRRQQTADDGTIVVALVGDEATCKRLRRRGRSLLLEPANPQYQPISPDDCTLLGAVTGVLRRLQ